MDKKISNLSLNNFISNPIDSRLVFAFCPENNKMLKKRLDSLDS